MAVISPPSCSGLVGLVLLKAPSRVGFAMLSACHMLAAGGVVPPLDVSASPIFEAAALGLISPTAGLLLLDAVLAVFWHLHFDRRLPLELTDLFGE